MDERAQQIGTRAATITLTIAYMFWLAVAFSKFIGTGRIETAAAEIVFLALIPFVLLWFARQDERLFLPRLREHDDLQELLSPRHVLRRARRYALEALGFSVSLTVADYLAERLTGDIMTLLPPDHLARLVPRNRWRLPGLPRHRHPVERARHPPLHPQDQGAGKS